MYRYQKKSKTIGTLLVLTLLILTSVSVFPSPVLAQDEVWDCPDIPITLDLFEPAPQYCSGPLMPPLFEVKKLILGVVRPPPVPELTLLVDLWPEMTMERGVSLEWVMNNSWSSTTHSITVVPGPEYDIIEVTFEPPIPVVDQVCLSYFQDIPGSRVDVVLLQLLYSPPEDFGDAPDPTYPTLLASNGARHQITGLFLGAVVDGEPDGQPTATADGDDINSDDEDGVTFTTLLIPGNTANVSVVASAAGLLDAWVDFNIDGDWSDAGEQIFTNQPLVAGVNNLSFGVPAGTTSGSTFARFRLSSNGNLSFDGLAPDGEVEDYKILISELGSISGLKFEDINGNGAKDPGEAGIPNWTIQLKDEIGNPVAAMVTDGNGDYYFGSLSPGTYQVHEALLLGWTQTVPDGTGYHEVTLSSGQNVEDVDFGNQYIGEPPVLEVGGEVYSVDKLTILSPWLVLVAVLIVGTAVAVRRRRAGC